MRKALQNFLCNGGKIKYDLPYNKRQGRCVRPIGGILGGPGLKPWSSCPNILVISADFC